MLSYSSLHGLHTGALSLPDFLDQVEQRYEECEASVQALIPEENRFVRLSQDADAILADFPDPSERPPLYGALVGAKDIFHVEGFATQAGSRLPVEVLQGKQAESVTRLKNAGALILGKTVTTEFAYFSPGPTRNPHNPEHTPGGSSSGSAAAVAAGYCHIALGTQTIGSIIRPASFCGVVGVKPTYERISRQGVIPLSPSLDHVGFFAPDVDTAIQAAKVLYNDFNERTQLSKKPRLGMPDGPYLEKTSRDGIRHFEPVCKELQYAGYSVQRIPMMLDLVEIISRHHVIMSAEAAQVHAEWFDAYETLYSAKFIELIRRGQAVTSDQLQGALAAQNEFRAEMRKAFSDHDIDFWICPSTVGAAPKGLESTGDPILNLPWTQAGLPTINLPAGKNEEGLPLGLQIVGNWYMDESLLFAANDLEKVLSTL